MSYETPTGEPSHSLIHVAATRGLATLVQRALDMGTDASKPTWDDTTALHCTSFSWNSEAVIKCLLSAGAELDAVDMDGNDPLLRACVAGNFSTALFLLNAGARISSRVRGVNRRW